MNLKRILYIFLLFTGVFAVSFQQWSCSKEYSYEGSDTTNTIKDSTAIQDSLPVADTTISCSFCHVEDTLTTGTWNFKNNQSYFCGTTTNAGFIGTNTFTFFGPSACSIDSGLVITAYWPMPFDTDKFNITTNNVAFYYYDHKSNTDIFIKLPPLPFSLTVQRYNKTTGIATGTFEGTVYTSNRDTTHISRGRFMIILK